MKLYNRNIILNINFKIDNDRMLAFEFSTDDIWVDDADCHIDLFRVEYHKETEEIYVLVAWNDDYDVGDDITHLCDAQDIFNYCVAQDKVEPVEDSTVEYEEYIIKEIDYK